MKFYPLLGIEGLSLQMCQHHPQALHGFLRHTAVEKGDVFFQIAAD